MWMSALVWGLLVCSSPVLSDVDDELVTLSNKEVDTTVHLSNKEVDTTTANPNNEVTETTLQRIKGANGNTLQPRKYGFIEYFFNKIKNTPLESGLKIKNSAGSDRQPPATPSSTLPTTPSPTPKQGLIKLLSAQQRMSRRDVPQCNDTKTSCGGESGQCVDHWLRCDGRSDYTTCGGDGGDELDCVSYNCSGPMTKCGGGAGLCMEHGKRCDGRSDFDTCGRDGIGSDELDCDSYNCSRGRVKCGNNSHLCVETMYRCDGGADSWVCHGDGTDEAECETYACPIGREKCDNNRTCFDVELRCDGVANCGDRSDEQGCENQNCTIGRAKCADNITCFNLELRCDGDANCNDTSDEQGCDRYNCTGDRVKCGRGNGLCIERQYRCDGVVHNGVDGSRRCGGDGSDEVDCAEYTKTHIPLPTTDHTTDHTTTTTSGDPTTTGSDVGGRHVITTQPFADTTRRSTIIYTVAGVVCLILLLGAIGLVSSHCTKKGRATA